MDFKQEKRKVAAGVFNALEFCDENANSNNILDENQVFIDEDQGFSSNSNKNNRRRSSIVSGIGGSSRRKSSYSMLSEAEQTRIIDMYKTVIQMSSENKLNEKNSWNFDLIDHMGKLIRDENKSVNFQKASCTLDASVKIYSNRVDDVYSCSHRVLESLTRNNANSLNTIYEEDDDQQNHSEENPDGATGKKTKPGSKATSNKLNIAVTIEKQVQNINQAKVEHDSAIDPMFQKLSKSFDEGGAKGMLLYNMRVSSRSSALAFLGNKELESMWHKTEESFYSCHGENQATSNLKIFNVLEKTKIDTNQLTSRNICSKLEEYRTLIQKHDTSTKQQKDLLVNIVVPEVNIEDYQDLLKASATNNTIDDHIVDDNDQHPMESQQNELRSNSMELSDIQMETDDHHYDDDHDQQDFPELSYEAPAIFQEIQQDLPMTMNNEEQTHTKLPWSTILPETTTDNPTDSSENGHRKNDVHQLLDHIATKITVSSVDPTSENHYENPEHTTTNIANEYNFFDLEKLSNAASTKNAWAGARHWKFAMRLRHHQQQPGNEQQDTQSLADDTTIETSTSNTTNQKKKSTTKKTTKETRELLNKIVYSLDNLDLIRSKLQLPSDTTPKTGVKNKKSAAAKKTSNKRDPTLLTKAAIDKLHQEYDNQTLILPTDEKLELKDLCRLHLMPKTLVVPAGIYLNLTNINQNISSNSGKYQSKSMQLLRGLSTGQENLWEQARMQLQIHRTRDETQRTAAATASGNERYSFGSQQAGHDYYDGGDDSGGMQYQYFNDDNDQPHGSDFHDTENISPNTAEPISAENVKLVQATRVVEKIDIGYAKVAKRVNVHKLKHDMWQELNTKLGTKPKEKVVEEVAEEKTSQEVNFQELVHTFQENPAQRQEDASVAYYFICLLHLANEKGLKITDREDLSNLTITMN